MNTLINRVKLEEFARELGVRFVVLYGSYAVGDHKEKSDVDVAVLFDPESIPASFDKYSKCLEMLGKIFSLPSPIDFVVLNNANILLRYEITSKGKLLYGDEDDYEQYKAFAFRDYFDAKELFSLEELLINRRQTFLKGAII